MNETPWNMRAEDNVINSALHDRPVIILNPYGAPYDGDFIFGLKTMVEPTPEQAERAEQAGEELAIFNLEAVRLTRKQLTFLRDRVNSLLEIP